MMSGFDILKERFLSWAPVMGLCVLLTAVLVTYYPSLFHLARADQLSFLVEYAGREGSVQTILDSLYYNRTRLFSPGDVLLFRPLLFLMLSLQKALFGYDAFLWQCVALSAHLFTIAALYRLLCRWSENRKEDHAAAGVVMIFFAFLFVNIEAVIWHGIMPYVFFAGLIFIALERLDVFIVSAGNDRRALGWCALVLLAAVHIYEAGIWYILCFFVGALLSLRGTGRAHRAGILLIPLAIYAAWSAGHWVLAGISFDPETRRIVQEASLARVAGNFLMALKWFVVSGFFLQPQDVVLDSRLIVKPHVLMWQWPLNGWLMVRWAGAGVFVLLASLAWRGGCFIKGNKDIGRIVLLCAMLAGYLLIIVLGRLNVREFALTNTVYYFYNFWTLLTALFFLLIRRAPLISRPCRTFSVVLAVLVIVFSACNAWSIFSYTSLIKERQARLRVFLKALDRFVVEHKNEPDFSFSLRPDDPFNRQFQWAKKGDPPDKTYSLPERLYPEYFNKKTPKYLLNAKLLK